MPDDTRRFRQGCPQRCSSRNTGGDLKNGGDRWEAGPRHIRTLSKSVPDSGRQQNHGLRLCCASVDISSAIQAPDVMTALMDAGKELIGSEMLEQLKSLEFIAFHETRVREDDKQALGIAEFRRGDGKFGLTFAAPTHKPKNTTPSAKAKKKTSKKIDNA